MRPQYDRSSRHVQGDQHAIINKNRRMTENYDKNPYMLDNRRRKPVYKLKCVIIGDLGVGKTQLIRNFVQDKGSYTLKSSCIWEKEIIKDFCVVCLSIWDTAGQERYRSLTGSYYRGANCCIIVFDVNRLETFNNVSEWLANFKYNSPHPERVSVVLVGIHKGNEGREVSKDKAEKLADHLGVVYMEVNFHSLNDAQGVFDKLIEISLLESKKNSYSLPRTMRIYGPFMEKKRSWCACI